MVRYCKSGVIDSQDIRAAPWFDERDKEKKDKSTVMYSCNLLPRVDALMERLSPDAELRCRHVDPSITQSIGRATEGEDAEERMVEAHPRRTRRASFARDTPLTASQTRSKNIFTNL